MDLNGSPWIVDNAGQVFKWSGSSFVPFGGSFVASFVASGSGDEETWAVQKSDTSIWNWSGTRWQPVPGSYGVKIAVFSEIDACGHHVAWVLDPANNVFRYVPGASCSFPGAFSQLFAAAFDLTTDLVVGTDDEIYAWNRTNGDVAQVASR